MWRRFSTQLHRFAAANISSPPSASRFRSSISPLCCSFASDSDVPLSARNILEDPKLKNAVKTYSNWPTFPQIFIKGEFIGGSDIILNMHQTGELKEKLKGVATDKERPE